MQDKLTIAFVVPRFTGPFGPERSALTWAGELAGLGQNVTVYTHRFDDSCRHLVGPDLNLVVTGFPPVRNHVLSTFFDFVLMPWLCLRVKAKYDVIQGITWQAAFGLRLIRLMRRGGRALTAHWCTEPPRFLYDLLPETFGSEKAPKHLLVRPVLSLLRVLDRWALRSVDLPMCLSRWIKAEVERIYGREFEVVYPGVETERFQRGRRERARERLGIPHDETVFLSVSKLHRRKRLDRAMAIFAELAPENSVFYVLGDGPHREMYRAVARDVAPDRIRLVGRVSDDDVALYMSAADYCIFVAKNEPFGMAPVEAALSGCWVISEGTAGFKEVIPECVVSPSAPLPRDEPPSLDDKVLGWDVVARRTLEMYRQRLSGGNW
jgi:glycosyltransferase involved in cell wall biosynthesis